MDEEAKEAEKTKAPQDSKEGKATEDKTETEIKAGENPKETQVQNIPPASPPIPAEPSATISPRGRKRGPGPSNIQSKRAKLSDKDKEWLPTLH